MISPLGKRTTVYQSHRGWSAIYTIIQGAPTQDVAQAAADAFTTPYAAGWRDAMTDLWTLWVEQGAREAEAWLVGKFTLWLRNAVGRLAPGAAN